MARRGINPLTGKRYEWEERQKAEQAEERAQREIEQRIQLLKRQKAAVEAKDDLLRFTQFTMPHPEDPNDVERSLYEAAPFHRAIARHLEEMERGEITQLILTLPPRHGKSQLAAKHFVAWYMGRNPYDSVAVATYSDTMAEDYGGDVRAIVSSAQFKQIFPGYRIRKGSNSKSNLQSDKGGRAVFVGAGGALTGRGANCFVGSTSVLTRDGNRQIRSLRVNDEVLSYDEKAETLRWRRIQAVSRRKATGLLRITTAAGRVVEVTRDHPFYSGTGWVEAAALTPGDRLLCAVRETGDAKLRGSVEALQERPRGILLLDGLLGSRDEHQAVRRTAVHEMRRGCTESDKLRHASIRTHLLLQRVRGSRTGGRVRAACVGANEALRALQRDVCAGARRHSVLFPGMLFAGAFGAHAEGGQSALEKWSLRAAFGSAYRETVPGDEAPDPTTGRRTMRALREHQEVARPSHRRGSAEQSGSEFSDALPEMSPPSAFFRRQADAVRKIEQVHGEADVYDIQVEEDHCFFANGILVHNCLIIDDIVKNADEARSQTIRDAQWDWFTKVAMTRRMGKKLVIIILTRWHSDDLVGRITDPENPHYNAIEAKGWKIINIPAIAEEDDPLGREPGEPLWPERYPLEFLQQQQRLDPMGFAALYQQRPTVADGVLFRRETIQFYRPEDLPDDLRIYCASDHAVATGQRNDFTVLVKVGVDRQNNIWVLDVFRNKVSADKAVEAMIAMASGPQKPLLWWAERGHISKSIGPFLRKRMLETGVYINLREVTPATDKEQRAQAIAARVAMGKVYFPKHAVWTEKVVNEMLAFPNGTHDDVVDALAYIGLGMQSQFGPGVPKSERERKPPAFGTLDWVKLQDRWAAEQRAAQAAGGF